LFLKMIWCTLEGSLSNIKKSVYEFK